MANYRAWFRGIDRIPPITEEGDLYCVHIGDFSAVTYTELPMAEEQPFVVTYNTNNTPFDPVRTSTASMRFVSNNYMTDVLPSAAQEISVILYNETKGRIEWCGYLTPKIYDNGFSDCLEIVQLEAADCISVLQYVDYHSFEIPIEVSGVTGFAKLQYILGSICNETLLTGYGWIRGKYADSIELVPDTIILSEDNFKYSDTGEYWKMSEVLEEICKYYGVTCLQEGDTMYFIDFMYFKNTSAPTQMSCKYYSKLNNYAAGNNYRTLSGVVSGLTQDDMRGSDASVSFEPVYNKCVVKANTYASERIVQSIFDDDYLTNRISGDNYYQSYRVNPPSPDTPSYPWGSKFIGIGQNYHEDGSGDSRYSYYHRIYDHQDWESVYDSGATTTTGASQGWLTSHVGATIVDLGVVRNAYISDYGQNIIPSKLDYTRYLMIRQNNVGSFASYLPQYPEIYWKPLDYPVFRLKNTKPLCPYNPSNAYIVIKGSAIFTKYIDRPYINPEWETNPIKPSGGSYSLTDGNLRFSIGIGNKYWDGEKWVTGKQIFNVVLEKTNDNYGSSNLERHVLNNVSYGLGIGEDGYLIPLSGIPYSLGQELHFEIHLPGLQWIVNGSFAYNGFCWIKDFDVKLVEKGQEDKNREGDMVYENVISDDAVNEIREITCKLTSYTSGVAPTYSTVMYNKTVAGSSCIIPMTGFTDNGATTAREGEYNIVQKYVDQYSTPTKKITMTVDSQDNRFKPWSYMRGFDPDNMPQLYVPLGEEIDFAAGTKTITAVQFK